jgi:hypothetical protein
MPATEGRKLTQGEQSLAATMFGDSVDYAPVRIHRRKYWPFHPKRAIMAPDGHIWVHPRGPLWSDDYSAASIPLQALFLHEMTHVWQAQKRGKYYLPLMRHPFCRYAYSIRLGWPFDRYGLEQQAEIVRHAFLLRRGRGFPGAPSLAQLENILPFKETGGA